MHPVSLHPTRCALCGTEGNSSEMYPGNFDPGAFTTAVFSARRIPDRIHYRLVRCNRCGLVRSDPIAGDEALKELYTQSRFTYSHEVSGLRSTYGRYLLKLDGYGAHKGSLLEIGCGNGFFLEKALDMGYAAVSGVEPSAAAVAAAPPRVRPSVICDTFHSNLFAPEQFDVICMFQVLDHIPAPAATLKECFRILKRGGIILAINHNVTSFSARLLRESSPIIDIEHTYLYSPSTMHRLCESNGFKIHRVGTVLNCYSIFYIIWLAPLPRVMKSIILSFLAHNPIGRLRLKIPLGNFYCIAQKPV